MKYKKFNRICILDTETTGVYWNSSAPVEVAAIICNGDGEILSSFVERIKTTHRIPKEASEVHGIYNSDLEFCRSEKDVLLDLVAWLSNEEVDCILTYNGEAFDRPMLNERCKKLFIETDFFKKEVFPGIDGFHNCVLHARRANLWGLKDKLGRKWKLTLVAESLGFSSDGAHAALADVMMLKNIFFKVDPLVNPTNWIEDKEKEDTLF